MTDPTFLPAGPSQGTPSAGISRYGILVLLAGALTMMGTAGFARYAFPMLLPDMRIGLNASYGLMGLLVTANNIGYVTSSFLAGFASARFGPRRLISSSMLLAGLATIATGLSPTIELGLLMQLLVGLGAGSSIVPAVALVAGSFERRRRGVATGVIVGGLPLGILLSSFFLPAILGSLGPGAWRYGWIALGSPVILIALVDLLVIRDQPPGSPAQTAGGQPAASSLQWNLVYKSHTIWLLCAINLAIGLAAAIFTTFFVAYLVDERGLPSLQAAQAWGLFGLVGIFSGLLWGYISDVAGRRFALTACYVCYFFAIFLLAFVHVPGAELASGFLGGLTITGGLAITVALLSDTVGPELSGAAYGLISLFFNTGLIISPSLAGTITDATGTFAASLIAATAVCFLSAAMCLFLRPPRFEDAL